MSATLVLTTRSSQSLIHRNTIMSTNPPSHCRDRRRETLDHKARTEERKRENAHSILPSLAEDLCYANPKCRFQPITKFCAIEQWFLDLCASVDSFISVIPASRHSPNDLRSRKARITDGNKKFRKREESRAIIYDRLEFSHESEFMKISDSAPINF